MSARVFNPMVMSEMRRMLRAGAAGGGENGQAASAVGPDGVALARVKRNLFGPVDHEEAQRFVERELAAQQRRDADIYGFDFVRGVPRKSGPGTRRFVWEKVLPKEAVPEPYALRRLPYLREHTDEPAVATVCGPAASTTVQESTSKGHVAEDAGCGSSTVESTPVMKRATKQSHIYDYMKSRKRPSNNNNTSKTTITESSPCLKQARKSLS